MRRYIAAFLTMFTLLQSVALATDTMLSQDIEEKELIPITIDDNARKDYVLKLAETLRKSAAEAIEIEPTLLERDQTIDFMDATYETPDAGKEATGGKDCVNIMKTYRENAEKLNESLRNIGEGKSSNFLQNDAVVTLGYEVVFGGGRAYLYDEFTEECIPLFTDGDGSSSNPFIISTAEDLFQLAFMVNEFGDPMFGAHFYQTEDIDLNTSSRNPWTPIGLGTKGEIYSFFGGVYNGNRHTISGAYVKGRTYDLTGLFGATLDASIYELNIADSTISGGYFCAPLVGYAAATYIYGCTVSSDVKVSSFTNEALAGGLVAVHLPYDDDNGSLSYCISNATVSASNNAYMGGIAGNAWAHSSSDTLPIIGCRFGGKLSGGIFAGGIVGLGHAIDIMLCYNTGSVSAEDIAAGIVSSSFYTVIYSCYNTGTISNSLYSSGIAGSLENSTIECCYNVGTVKADDLAYDIVCFRDVYTGVYWCYWTCAKDPDAIKITKTELKKKSNLAGFDFRTIWGYESGENSGYPILKIFYPQILSYTSSYNQNDPENIVLYIQGNYNPVLSISGVPSGWWILENYDTTSEVVIYHEFFEKYVPSGTYTYRVNFGAGCTDTFTIKVNNCIHEYGYTDVKKATCTETGYYRVYCTECNKLLYELDYERLGHDFEDEYTTDRNPTCTERGMRSRHCSRCTAIVDEGIMPAYGHNYAIAAGKKPTCSQVGWEDYTYCTRCDYSTRQDIPMIPHNLRYHEGKEMTWQEPGWEPYVTCTNCDYTTYCEILPIHPESVSVSAPKNTVGLNEQIQCTATVFPLDTTHKAVSWLSSDESVLVVDENGLVTAISSGTAKIQAITEDGGKKGELELSVKRAITDIEIIGATTVAKGKSITLKANTYCCEKGEMLSIKGTVLWRSADESIATVSSKGKVVGKAAGVVTITAYSPETLASASVEITVAAPIKSMKFTSSKTTVYVGSTFNLGEKLTISPFDNTDRIEWSSSKPSICTVDENGIVTPIATGTAKIKAKAVTGNKTATCTVTVCKEPEGIIITGDTAVAKGKSITLKGVAYYEENGKTTKTKDAISWSSSDESIVTVTSKGKVTGKCAGSATITAYIEGTDIEETIEISVVIPVKTVKLSKTKMDAEVYDVIDLTEYLTVSPQDHTDVFVWMSSKTSVATVDENGIVTIKGVGKTKITVKAQGGKKSASITITVK